MAKQVTTSKGFKPRLNEFLSGIEGLTGLPFIAGTWYFVDPTDGSATNTGKSPLNAFASIKSAYDACTTGAGDGICVISRGITSAGCTSYLTAALDWTKWGITVIGIAAPTKFSQRARISTAAANLAYLIDVQGSNNIFKNLSFYNGGTTGAGGVKVSGGRNYFENVHFMGGMGMTTPTVNDYSLTLTGTGCEENTFVGCVLGNDTFNKGDVASAELILTSGTQRNRFVNCEFLTYRSAGTTAGFIKSSGGDSITRTLLFDNCFFHVYRDGNVTSEAAVFIGTVPNNGFIIFKDCFRHGVTDWAAVAATGRVYSASLAATEAGGITIAVNPS